DGIRDRNVTGVQTCALPILHASVPEALERDDRVLGSGAHARAEDLPLLEQVAAGVGRHDHAEVADPRDLVRREAADVLDDPALRSEENTSELQSRFDLVCRL